MTAFEISVASPLFLQKAVKIFPQYILGYFKMVGVVILYHYLKCIFQYVQFSSYIYGNRLDSYILYKLSSAILFVCWKRYAFSF